MEVSGVLNSCYAVVSREFDLEISSTSSDLDRFWFFSVCVHCRLCLLFPPEANCWTKGGASERDSGPEEWLGSHLDQVCVCSPESAHRSLTSLYHGISPPFDPSL